MSKSPDIDEKKCIRGVKIKNLEQIFPHISLRKQVENLNNSDTEGPRLLNNGFKKTYNKIYVPHNRLPALHKKKTHGYVKNVGQTKISHLLQTYINRQKEKLVNRSLDSNNNNESIDNPNTHNLIQAIFGEELTSKPVKTSFLRENSEETLNKMIEIERKPQNNEKKGIINEEFLKSPVFHCLNIKKLVRKFDKFQTPILKKLTGIEKYETFFKENENLDKNQGILIKTMENESFSKKSMEIEKIDGILKKTQENIGNIVKKEENRPRKPKKKKDFGESKEPSEASLWQKYEFYAKLLNYSNNMTIAMSRTPNYLINYKVFIGKGNNKTLVKTLMKNRWWWTFVDSIEESPNFAWTQVKNKEFIELLKEPIIEIDALEPLDISITRSSLEQILHSPINTTNSLVSSEEVKNFIENLKKNVRNVKKQEFFKKNDKNHVFLKNPSEIRIHNHFESNFQLGNKKALFHNLKAYLESINEEVFSNIPVTFHIRKGILDPEYQVFLQYYHENYEKNDKILENPEEKSKFSLKKKLFIIKPGEHSNRGNGILITDDLNQIKQIISNKELHKNGKIKTFILQAYIENPLLYNKRKFDIRCYALITNFNKNMKGYWYKDGYIRTSSKEFSLKNLGNRLIHLTNDAIQKKGEEYGKFENSNKLSFEEFQKYMSVNSGEKKFDFTKIYLKMKELTTYAMRSVYGKLNLLQVSEKSMNFEIFGLDFMIDENFNVWLIEINTNPCLELSSPLLGRIIPHMLENAFRITIDTVLPPPFSNNYSKYQKIPNFLENNKFEIIFDESCEAEALRKIINKCDNEKNIGNLDDEDSEEGAD